MYLLPAMSHLLLELPFSFGSSQNDAHCIVTALHGISASSPCDPKAFVDSKQALAQSLVGLSFQHFDYSTWQCCSVAIASLQCL